MAKMWLTGKLSCCGWGLLGYVCVSVSKIILITGVYVQKATLPKAVNSGGFGHQEHAFEA